MSTSERARSGLDAEALGERLQAEMCDEANLAGQGGALQ
jgi:hypothetical protein